MISKLLRYFLPLSFILVLAVYAQAVNGPYLIDDISNLVNNDELVIDDLSYESLKQAALSSRASRFHRPVSMLTFAANYSIAGDKSPFSVKLTNIILHLIIGLGILLLSRRLLPRLLAGSGYDNRETVNAVSILATVIWLAHPLFVSTVLYSVQRMAMLSTLFVVYGCVVYIHFRNYVTENSRGHTALLLFLSLFTVTGFLSKENAVLLPGFALLIEYYCYGFRIPRTAPRWFAPTLKLFLVVPVLFTFGYLVYAYFINLDAGIATYPFTINQRLLTETRVLWHYLGWLALLNPEPYGIYHDDIPLSTGLIHPLSTLLSLLGWAALVVAAVRLDKRYRVFTFSLFWFLWGHVLESTTLPLALVFEHRNYLPGYGPILALSSLVGIYLHKSVNHRLVPGLIVLLLLVLPPLLLQERVRHWTDQKALATWLLINHPGSVHALSAAANYLSSSGDTRHALLALDRAQALAPDNISVLFNRLRTLCSGYPDRKFGDKVTGTMMSIPVTNTTINSRMYFNRLVNDCTGSNVNHGLLLRFYDRFSDSRDRQIAALSYFGKGKIYIENNNLKMAAEEWQKAADTTPEARKLIPAIEALREGNNKNKTGADRLLNQP